MSSSPEPIRGLLRGKHFYSLAAVVLGFGLLAGCGSRSGKDEPSCETPFDETQFPSATVSFQTDVAPILDAHGCSSIFCHGGTPPASDYSLQSSGECFGPGEQGAQLGVCDVVRGDPDASYLLKKITGSPGILGTRMPEGSPPMQDAEVDVIRQWVLEGARDN